MKWGDASIYEFDMWASVTVSKDQEMIGRMQAVFVSVIFAFLG